MSIKSVDTNLIIRKKADQLSKNIMFTVTVSVDSKFFSVLFNRILCDCCMVFDQGVLA